MITVSPDFSAALNADVVRPRWLVDIADFNWTTHHRDIVIGDKHWFSSGFLKALPSLKRERALKAHSITLKLTALDPTIRSYFMDTSRVGRPVAIHMCLLDTEGSVVGDETVTQYKGFIDEVVQEAGKSLMVKVQSPLAKPSQSAGRLITNAAQIDYSKNQNPGQTTPDRFMEQAHQKFENLRWGGE